MKEYYQKEIEQIKDLFKNHKVELIVNSPLDYRIHYKRPDTWNYGMTFIIFHNTLVVLGDLGQLIYQWHEYLKPAFLIDLELDYFSRKMTTISGADDCYSWDEDIVIERCGEHIATAIKYYIEDNTDEYIEEHYEEDTELNEDDIKRLTDQFWNRPLHSYCSQDTIKELYTALENVAYDKNELTFFARDNEIDLETLFHTDDISWIYDSGRRINFRVICHWLGIKMACEQIMKDPEEMKKFEF